MHFTPSKRVGYSFGCWSSKTIGAEFTCTLFLNIIVKNIPVALRIKLLCIISLFVSFYSCSKKDNPSPKSENIISSQIVSSSKEMMKNTVNKDGVIVLSYATKMKVRGQTKGEFETEVKINLADSLFPVSKEVFGKGWDMEEEKYDTQLTKRVRSTRKEGFVTITDSLYTYSVNGVDLKFAYQIVHQTAVYNDGFTKQEMESHKIVAIEDNGGKYEVKDSFAGDIGYAYARKVYRHSITIKYDSGKTQKLEAEVDCLKILQKLSDGPFIVNSKEVSSGVRKTVRGLTGWITTQSKLSNGETKIETFESDLNGYISGVRYTGLVTVAKKEDIKLKKVSVAREPMAKWTGSGGGGVGGIGYKDTLIITLEQFEVKVICERGSMTFSNIHVIKRIGEDLAYDANSFKITEINWREYPRPVEGGKGWYCEIVFTIELGGVPVEGYIEEFQVLVTG